ncbi:M24 family metallopeptidase [Palleronia caenipelagi]|uniref:Aminopeptidase P family protein n=1 Tax=Palleronia caenipelagi TaxID=2489174 RepID=A0A547PIY3_9RHOB|nr:Xaa-Pro peptidase family protein [Palleronia caenipelagi]TRD14087.1 aminopeptidase P family protein [Palleronia caenipelagi]
MGETAVFGAGEYEARCRRTQEAMAGEGLAAMLLTSEPDFQYFAGFFTRFWESPTRPWFLILPATGAPVAVIPGIGTPLMSRTWIEDIRSWDAPDYDDDGVSLLADTLRELTRPGDRLGVPMGRETSLRMPLADWERLCDLLPKRTRHDVSGVLREVQGQKSSAEIAAIRRTCQIAGRAFDRVPEILRPEVTLAELFRRFQTLLLEEGADWVRYLAGAAEQSGYADVISPAHHRPIVAGDVVMLDTGAVRDGYFCDYDRNWAIGTVTPQVQEAHQILFETTETAFDAARPGLRVCDLYHIMETKLSRHSPAPISGRLGHGLGIRLTEPPSLIAADTTELVPGMVLTLEPSLTMGSGKMLVHEENIVITEEGADWLSPRGPREIPVLEWAR